MTVLVAYSQPGAWANGQPNLLHTSIARPEEDSVNGHSNSSLSGNTQSEAFTNAHFDRKNYQGVVPTAIDEIAQRTPNAVFASIPKTSNPVDGYKDVTYKLYADTIDRAALLLEESIKGKDHGDTIGYIGPSDLRYVILAIAAVKINMKVGIVWLHGDALLVLILSRCSIYRRGTVWKANCIY